MDKLKKLSKRTKIIIAVVVVIIIIAIGAVAAILLLNKPSNNFTLSGGSVNGANAFQRPVTGTILNISGTSLVVDTTSQGQVIVNFSNSTRVISQDKASKDDVIKLNNSVMLELDSTDSSKVKSVTLNALRPASFPVSFSGFGGDQNPQTGTVRFGRGGNGGGFNGGGAGQVFLSSGTIGTISNIDGNKITIQDFRSNSTVYTIDDSTAFYKQDNSNTSALANGQNVTVLGRSDSVGIVSARNITINAQ